MSPSELSPANNIAVDTSNSSMSRASANPPSATPSGEQVQQLATFYIANRLYGIDVMRVQEVTTALPMTRVPLSPSYVHGLINLRGQISTAISLRELFELNFEDAKEQMNIVCKVQDLLVSFIVDRVGDVMELKASDFELAPETVPDNVRRFIAGVYKIPDSLLSVVDVDLIAEYFFKSNH